MKKSAYAPELYIDPVCFMKVIPRKDLMANHQLRSYYFCADGCRKAFEADPERYLDAKPPKRKGWWGRYLDRLNKTTQGKSLNCH
ncbi:MAG: YHS domain-containing protein [Desulfobacterales bacterium]